MPPRMIDNLGNDASTQYAENKENYDKSFSLEASGVAQQSRIDVTSPAYSSSLNQVLNYEPGQVIPWALFPSEVEIKPRPGVFQDALAPCLSAKDMMDLQRQRVKAFFSSQQEALKGDLSQGKLSQMQFEQEGLKLEGNHSILLKLFDIAGPLNEDKIKVTVEINRYHKA